MQPRVNNFDLIRIVAALQVVVWHSVEHLNVDDQAVLNFNQVMAYFPGVSIFFTVSGFLVFASFENNYNDPFRYFSNRALRIFPALWVSFIITILLLLIFSIIQFHHFGKAEILAWVVAQFSIGQFYTPDLLRVWGVGTPNGSLWTIPVEIQFYLLVPLIFWMIRKFNSKWALILFSIAIFSLSLNAYISSYEKGLIIRKVGSVLVFPYLYQFAFGVLIYKSWGKLRPYLEDKVVIWLCIYGIYCITFSYFLDLYVPSYWPNFLGLISHVLLALLTISAAFSYKGLSTNLLRGNDISYGVYIYHMLVINTFLTLDLHGNVFILLYSVLASCILGFLSWRIIERPALELKRALAKAYSR